MKPGRLFIGITLTIPLLFSGTAIGQEKISGDLMIFCAGSLSVPFKEIGEAFNKVYPDVRILQEMAGSRTCARKISDLHRPCDVMGSADYSVIDTLLIPEHADWNIKFATNEMVIAWLPHGKKAVPLTAENWPQVLADPDMAYGRSDPDMDPCGYRSILTIKLAENHYQHPGLADRLLNKDTNYIRPKETDLLALLEVGAIDYLFIYRSVAQQHGLKYVLLPDAINLKKAELAEAYAQVSVDISGKKPGERITKKGAPMVYGVTIPKNAPNPKAVEAFVKFLLTADQGLAIMEQNGQPSVVPAPTSTYASLPDTLKPFAEPE